MDGNFRVAQWLVQPQLNLIQGPDGNTSVEPKAMEVLVCLAKQPGEVVPKERLMRTVWADTFVTDEVLTNAIWELRKAFSDDAKQPKVIQTVFKKGYRIVTSVSFDTEKVAGVREEGRETSAAAHHPAVEERTNRWVWSAALVGAALLVSAVAWLQFSRRGSVSAPPPRPVPLTSLPGSEIQPALSPDGNQVAFAWSRHKEENYDIYLKVIGSEKLIQLSYDPWNELSPAWSPEARQIAFLRLSDTQQTIVIVPALGGPERILYSSKEALRPGRGLTRVRGRTLSWSPDGRYLAAAESRTEGPDQIIIVSVETGEKRILFSPSSDFVLKYPSLSFSPDGRFLAFASSLGSNVTDIYLFPYPAGQPSRLTFANSPIYGLDWTNNGQWIIFSREGPTGSHLFRAALSGGETELLTWSGDGALFPSFSRRRNSLAYVQTADDLNIWRLDVAESPALTKSIPVVSSTRHDSNPKFSPDGKRMLFNSFRSGTSQIWICNSDGSNPLQLTSFGGGNPLGSPRWSQDGRAIAFDMLPEGHRDIFVATLAGGIVTRLTQDKSQDVRPSWSRDGSWIYFGSSRTGQYQVWKVPSTGGTAVQVTRQGGREALESPDGKFVYYSKGAEVNGLWRVPVEGGVEIRILDEPRQGYWDVTERGIYFIAYSSGTIKLYDFTTHRTTDVAAVEGEIPWGLPGFSVSPDGRQFLITFMDRFESDLMLVENFR